MSFSHLHERVMASWGARHRAVLERRAGGGNHHGGRVRVLMGVDPDDEVDVVCQHGHAFIPLPEGRGWFRSGQEAAGL
jgi:hypothetical protein